MKPLSQLFLIAVTLSLVACSGTDGSNSPHMTTAPSGSNGTTQGSPSSGQPSGAGAGSTTMRQ